MWTHPWVVPLRMVKELKIAKSFFCPFLVNVSQLWIIIFSCLLIACFNTTWSLFENFKNWKVLKWPFKKIDSFNFGNS
jgi:hypothetical protein